VNALSRFGRLPSEQKLLLLEAAKTLGLASLINSVLPFRNAIRFGAIEISTKSDTDIGECVWAVEAASLRLPLRTKCIEKGIALQRMLRRRGVDARLRYGARIAGNEVEAHVWVTVGVFPVMGGAEASGFSEVASFP